MFHCKLLAEIPGMSLQLFISSSVIAVFGSSHLWRESFVHGVRHAVGPACWKSIIVCVSTSVIGDTHFQWIYYWLIPNQRF